MKHLRLSIVAAFLLMSLATTDPPTPISAYPGEAVSSDSIHLISSRSFLSPRTPSHDTYVKKTEPNKNFDGEDLATSTNTSDCTPTDITYLQWDLPEITEIETVLTTTLALTATAAIGTSSAQLSLYETGDNWTEDTLNYGNAPLVGELIETIAAPPPGIPPSPAIVAFSSVTLTAYIDAQAHGDGVASFALRFSAGCTTPLTLAAFRDTESGANGPGLVLETVTYAPDLAIHKAAPEAARSGETITYTLAYSNTGNVPAQQVVISDLLPTGVTTATAAYTYTGAIIASRAGSTFVWDVTDDLPPGAEGVITITVSISPTFFTDTLSNTATIATSTVESRSDNNTATATTAMIIFRYYFPVALSKAEPVP